MKTKSFMGVATLHGRRGGSMARGRKAGRKRAAVKKKGAFENVKDQIGRCGIYCGSCAIGNGTLRELARRLERVYRSYGVNHWGPKDYDIENFLSGLTSIQGIPLCQGCLKGGGKEDCELKWCVRARKLNHCTECSLFAKCEHAELLEHMHTGSRAAGMLVMKKGEDRHNVLRKWIKEMEVRRFFQLFDVGE